MKRNEFKLLVENWRKNLVLEMHDDDHEEDIHAPFPEEMSSEHMGEDLLDDDMHHEEENHHMPMMASGDDREDMLRRFCDMMGIECDDSEIRDFLAGQAEDAGYDIMGDSLDDDMGGEVH